MTFLYPLGLLGLIGVPVLIIVYIIKSKYTEQTVSTTYIWTLSERFLKKRNPLSKLTGIISLILQILVIAVLSFTIAHPVFTLSGAANEYCFILDGSGSMNMEVGGKTRFDEGKERISEMIDSATEGSRFSLIYVSDDTRVVFEGTESKEQANALLAEISAVHSGEDYTDALEVAQGYFNENNSVLTYLVTDKSYEVAENITVVNVGKEEFNCSIYGVNYSLVGTELRVFGKVISHTADTTVNVEVYADGENAPVVTGQVELAKGVESDFELRADLVSDEFFSLDVKIKENDALSLDNRVVIYNVESENSYKTLIVSDRPFFIEQVISAVSAADIDTVSVDDYSSVSGYGLYIFDSFVPDSMPSDGTVWFVNPDASVQDSGFSVQGPVELDKADTIDMSSSTSSSVKKLIGGMSGEGIYITGYQKCGLYNNFTTLFSYKGNPLVFTGVNGYGNREVVFAFDFIGKSNFTMQLDFILLVGNLLDYSFPEVLDRTSYKSGETLEMNVIAGCESIRVDTPLGNVEYLDTSGAVSELVLTEAGVYAITVMIADTPREFYVYSELPESERSPLCTEESIGLSGEAGTDGIDGIYDDLMIFFICLAVLFVADWMVYCYEKYQLR